MNPENTRTTLAINSTTPSKKPMPKLLTPSSVVSKIGKTLKTMVLDTLINIEAKLIATMVPAGIENFLIALKFSKIYIIRLINLNQFAKT